LLAIMYTTAYLHVDFNLTFLFSLFYWSFQ
jgi:hypothetical protein